MTALTNINLVIESDWTNDYFIALDDDPETLILYAGDPDDADLYFAVGELVAGWPCAWDGDSCAWVYTRPEG